MKAPATAKDLGDQGVDMPVFGKRRFQHGATRKVTLCAKLPAQEAVYRKQFLAMYQ